MFEAVLSDIGLVRIIILLILFIVLGVTVASLQDDAGGIYF